MQMKDACSQVSGPLAKEPRKLTFELPPNVKDQPADGQAGHEMREMQMKRSSTVYRVEVGE